MLKGFRLKITLIIQLLQLKILGQSLKVIPIYIKKKNGIIPDSLKNNIVINIPIQSIVVTSTTHIPSLEMLNEEKSLVGFPNLAMYRQKKFVL